MRTIINLSVLALAAIAACATPNLDDPPPPIMDAPPSKHPAGTTNAATSPLPTTSGSSSTLPPAPSSSASAGNGGNGGSPFGDASVDAGPQSRRWKGLLGSTTPVDFGGGQECHYRITFQQVNVDVTAAANGDIVAANVTALAVEQVLSNPCNNTAIPAHTHYYALTTAAVLSSGLSHLELSGPSTNHPQAALVIEGDFKAAEPALSLKWHRTDFGPPLDWTVNAHVTVKLQ
ncbi:MAG: hypothetical protein JWO86_6880 [Myxococcaceae bacterium]|nr:hypothetical protein [Myxococcaceae bacterium]